MPENAFVVTANAMRPRRMDGTCFYCWRRIGRLHAPSCVLIMKRVKVRLVVEYEVDMPAHWTGADFESHRNEGSWCGDNALSELETLVESRGQHCACGIVKYEFVQVSGPAELKEQ